jgi:nicotinate phosphoribosyltransferase
MIQSLLDNDQYKFTMQQALLKLGFASIPVEYKFQCRTKDIFFSSSFRYIKSAINDLSGIKLEKNEYDFLRSRRYFSDEYLQFLKGFKFDPQCVDINIQGENLHLKIRGPWFNTILFEVPILSIISQHMCRFGSEKIANDRLDKKLKKVSAIENFKYGDFGTRRRNSLSWHNKVIKKCKEMTPHQFIGTSNLFFALKYNIKAIGTMAHEWLQAHQQLNYRLIDSQKMAFENWIKVYRDDLGIALSDVINTESFLKDFSDPLFYKLFSGVREDSEKDPIRFGHQIIDFYNLRGIDPKTKTIIFSNGLNFDKAVEIFNSLHSLINVSFGIGTNLTNDFDKPALNIVIKMISCNHQPVAKISNSPGKGMCENAEFLNYLKSVFKID